MPVSYTHLDVYKRQNLDLRLRAIASSKKMLLDARGINSDWRERFDVTEDVLDLDRFTAHLTESHLSLIHI